MMVTDGKKMNHTMSSSQQRSKTLEIYDEINNLYIKRERPRFHLDPPIVEKRNLQLPQKSPRLVQGITDPFFLNKQKDLISFPSEDRYEAIRELDRIRASDPKQSFGFSSYLFHSQNPPGNNSSSVPGW